MKSCPYCAQQIQDEAIKCRFCQSWLVPPPPGFAPGPAMQFPAQSARRTSGMAIASLVLGVLWMYWLGSILALVFGYLAKRDIRDSRSELEGSGMATAGIVLGWVGIATLVLTIGIIALGFLGKQEQKRQRDSSHSQHAEVASPPQALAPGSQPKLRSP